MENLILATDSYKLTHAAMYPEGTTGVFSYLEARAGARDPYTVFFGLQPILDALELGVNEADFEEALGLSNAHMGPGVFNEAGWRRILDHHGGRLPLRIKAVAEGSVVPICNALMTVENLDPQLPWLTNVFESKLLHVWYPTTVATTSRRVKEMYVRKLEEAGSPTDGVDFMLHDFGYRGVSSDESAAAGAAAHLTSFKGSDTLVGMRWAVHHYHATLDSLAFSVPATEHSVMTSLGKLGEHKIVDSLLTNYPTGIISVVADSYDIFHFVQELGSTFKARVLDRDGKFVVRPDSGDPLTQVPALLGMLWESFDGTTTSKGFKVLDPHVGLLWGDGLDGLDEIEAIIDAAMRAGFSPINLVFGMGGGLLQKVNRDTERFAFKCSAQRRNGVWLPVQKNPLDRSKSSKGGRLMLVTGMGGWATVTEDNVGQEHEALEVVFEGGEVTRHQTFEDVRKLAAL